MAATHPVPSESAVNQVMLSAWRMRGELMLQHCRCCEAVIYFPRSMCPNCWSADIWSRASSGLGRIETFSIIHAAVHDAFKNEGGAVVLAEVSVDEGVSLITRIICDDPSAVAIGCRVALYAGSDRDRYPLPVFALQSQG
jgi:uncharacterized OB-fold protein